VKALPPGKKGGKKRAEELIPFDKEEESFKDF
jgi:hypothetical protein